MRGRTSQECLAIAVALLVPACDLVLGVPPADLADQVQVAVHRRFNANDEQLVPYADVRPAPDAELFVTLADDTTPEIIDHGDGVWTFVRGKDQPYRLVMTMAGTLTEYQDTTPLIDVTARVAARPGSIVPSAGTQLEVTIANLPTVSGTTYLDTTGVWSQVHGSLAPNSPLLIESSQPNQYLTGTPGLLSAQLHDRGYCVFIAAPALPATPYYSLTQVGETSPIEMADGIKNTTACTLAPVPLDRCVTMDIRHAASATRLEAASTLPTPVIGSQWFLLARSDPSEGLYGAYLAYASASIPMASNTPDYAGDVHYVNPLPSHRELILINDYHYRPVTAPGATLPANVGVLAQTYVEPSTTSCGTPVTVTSTVAIPTTPILDGVSLLDDNVHVTIDREGLIPLEWAHGAAGPVDRYLIRLYELNVDSVGQTVFKQAYTWVARERHVAVDPALFRAGQPYIILIDAQRGLPNIADGDHTASTFPFEIGRGVSAMFIVDN